MELVFSRDEFQPDFFFKYLTCSISMELVFSRYEFQPIIYLFIFK